MISSSAIEGTSFSQDIEDPRDLDFCGSAQEHLNIAKVVESRKEKQGERRNGIN